MSKIRMNYNVSPLVRPTLYYLSAACEISLSDVLNSLARIMMQRYTQDQLVAQVTKATFSDLEDGAPVLDDGISF